MGKGCVKLTHCTPMSFERKTHKIPVWEFWYPAQQSTSMKPLPSPLYCVCVWGGTITQPFPWGDTHTHTLRLKITQKHTFLSIWVSHSDSSFKNCVSQTFLKAASRWFKECVTGEQLPLTALTHTHTEDTTCEKAACLLSNTLLEYSTINYNHTTKNCDNLI